MEFPTPQGVVHDFEAASITAATHGNDIGYMISVSSAAQHRQVFNRSESLRQTSSRTLKTISPQSVHASHKAPPGASQSTQPFASTIAAQPIRFTLYTICFVTGSRNWGKLRLQNRSRHSNSLLSVISLTFAISFRVNHTYSTSSGEPFLPRSSMAKLSRQHSR